MSHKWAATGKIENSEFSKQIFTGIGRENSYEGGGWLAIANDVRTRIASSDKIIFIPGLSY